MTKEEQALLKNMSEEELKEYYNKKELEDTATVKFLIEYLKTNFKPEDKVCYMDCVEGVKNDCVYVTKDLLGKRLFRYVKTDKEWDMKEHHVSKEQADKFFPFVSDDDIIVA